MTPQPLSTPIPSALPPDTVEGPDGRPRCRWCATSDALFSYHDREWGFPVADDRRLFEKICLEGFQAGLSWRTILSKRDNFRQAFADFDIAIIATFGDMEQEALLRNADIVRHRGKIAAVLNNARRAHDLIDEFGSLAKYFWAFEPDPLPNSLDAPPAQTVSISKASITLSKDLKKRGWAFVGPTTVHSFMQAMGLINGHVEGCVIRASVEQARRNFVRP